MPTESAPQTSCLNENEILSLFRGTLDGGNAASARAHVDTCAECQELLAFVVHASPRTLGSRPRVRAVPAALSEGTVIGRYRIREAIGAGAMGVVYLADDDELGRKVALKMLRTHDEAASKRLRREAQAIARIAHPNVVVVYEVGVFEEQVFMAMEFVEGIPLSAWLTKSRTLDEILDIYRQAGRGLAVAHAAGLVHRDFKPDNVLVGNDGRVRVVDFGLARPDSRPTDDGRGAPLASSSTLATLTRTGAFVGTPAYMAPEQYEGRAADTRTDQFAFCIALHEAIYGVRPFDADTLERLVDVVKRGKIRSPARSGVPTRIVRAIRRGLAVAPEERFPTMDALLEELARQKPRQKTAALGAAVLLGVVASALVARSIGGSRTTPPVAGHREEEARAMVPSAVSAEEPPSAAPKAATAPTNMASSRSFRRVAPALSSSATPTTPPSATATATATERDPLERRR